MTIKKFLSYNNARILFIGALWMGIGIAMLVSSGTAEAATQTCQQKDANGDPTAIQLRYDDSSVTCNTKSGTFADCSSGDQPTPVDGIYSCPATDNLLGDNSEDDGAITPDPSNGNNGNSPSGGNAVLAQSPVNSAFAGAGIDNNGDCRVRVNLNDGEVKALVGGFRQVTEGQGAGDVNIQNGGQLLCTYSVIKQIITWITFGAGIVALLLILVAGFLYMTAQDSEEKTGKAKKVLLAALVGLVIVVLAQTILRIVRSVL